MMKEMVKCMSCNGIEKVKTPYEDFFLLEKNMNLFSLEYKNVYYWQLVRFGLLKGITTINSHVVNQNINRSLKDEILGVVKEASRIRKKEKNIHKVDIIRIRPCVTISNKDKLDDHQYDYVQLSDIYSVMDIYALGAYNDVSDVVEFDMAPAEKELVFWKIKRKLFGANHIEAGQYKILVNFIDQINNIYGTKFDINVLENQIEYLVKCHIIYVKYYREIFSKTEPKIIMVYPHYDSHMFAAISVAKDMNIKVIEMQHGRINSHEAYWYEDQSVVGKLLPDYFFVYGNWWKDQINLPQFCNVEVVGNPYLEAQTNIYKKECDKNNKTLAVFSNPQNGKDLSELIYSLNDYWKEDNITILYKLHPNECKVWKREYPVLLNIENAKIIDDGTSVYKILANSDVAIGVNSTVFYEALSYSGINLLIYTIGDFEAMKPLLDAGMAKAVKDKKEVKDAIQQLYSDNSSNYNGNEFWMNDAANNIKKAVTDVISRSI